MYIYIYMYTKVAADRGGAGDGHREERVPREAAQGLPDQELPLGVLS